MRSQAEWQLAVGSPPGVEDTPPGVEGTQAALVPVEGGPQCLDQIALSCKLWKASQTFTGTDSSPLNVNKIVTMKSKTR